MSQLLDAMAPYLQERADPAWWGRQSGESEAAWAAWTDSGVRQMECSRTWRQAGIGERQAALAELSASPEPEGIEAG